MRSNAVVNGPPSDSRHGTSRSSGELVGAGVGGGGGEVDSTEHLLFVRPTSYVNQLYTAEVEPLVVDDALELVPNGEGGVYRVGGSRVKTSISTAGDGVNRYDDEKNGAGGAVQIDMNQSHSYLSYLVDSIPPSRGVTSMEEEVDGGSEGDLEQQQTRLVGSSQRLQQQHTPPHRHKAQSKYPEQDNSSHWTQDVTTQCVVTYVSSIFCALITVAGIVGIILYFVLYKATAPVDSFFPSRAVLTRLRDLTGMEGEQMYLATQLLLKPSLDSDLLNWNRASNYGFCEALPYDYSMRGFTVGLFRAKTGNASYVDTMQIDADLSGKTLLAGYRGDVSYAKTLTNATGGIFISEVRKAGEDIVWQEANWNAMIDFFLVPTIELLKPTGYMSPLTLIAALDCSINQGLGADHGTTYVMTKAGPVRSELEFLLKFLDARDTIVEDPRYKFNGPFVGHNRVLMYRELAKMAASQKHVMDLKGCQREVEAVTKWSV